ncbi:hypothetical protein [Neobacillus dielmonensis]|uniref:hypothetical protein n=1 Tax=Neobacillus dielmonensis TaxID=1347369 RepID=UPI0005A60B03|nr:hypothetical protein [Neobacillus dielmonensis]
MNTFEMTIGILIAGILAISLVYTMVSTRQHRTAEGNMDSKMDTHLDAQIAKPIQKHAYIKNPILISYGIFFALLLFIIFFIATAFY